MGCCDSVPLKIESLYMLRINFIIRNVDGCTSVAFAPAGHGIESHWRQFLQNAVGCWQMDPAQLHLWGKWKKFWVFFPQDKQAHVLLVTLSLTAGPCHVGTPSQQCVRIETWFAPYMHVKAKLFHQFDVCRKFKH